MSLQDAFAEVAAMPDVRQAASRARATLDPLLLDRRLRTAGAVLAAETALRNAHASASLEGAEVPVDEMRSRSMASPLLRVASGALEVQNGLRGMQALPPRQAWAAIATIAGREYLDDGRRGRPRREDEPLEDPLHLALPHASEDANVRLAMLAELLLQPTKAPALVVAAITHGELLALQPFGAANGVVARAAADLLLAQRGVDPDLLCMTDVGLVSLGRAAYVRAIRAYDGGGPVGVAAWCVHIATAFERGALLAQQTLDAIA